MLLIDCYNVLYTDMPVELAGLDEDVLCRLLAHTPWARQGIAVVCDGLVKPLGLTESPVDSVQLIYSGHSQSADDVIIEMIDAHTAPRSLWVISSDRQIRKAARRRRCRQMTSDRFIDLLAKSTAKHAEQGKQRGKGGLSPTRSQTKPSYGPLSDRQVRLWLKEFGVQPDDDLDSN